MLQKILFLALLALPTLAFARSEPVECFKGVTRNTSYNLETQLALKLCAGSKNGKGTVDCYRDATVLLDLATNSAIELCAEK